MPIAIKKCKVCGCEYEACHTNKISNGFRWQDVACSPECGAIYLARVMEARGMKENATEKIEDNTYQEPVEIEQNDPVFPINNKKHYRHKKRK